MSSLLHATSATNYDQLYRQRTVDLNRPDQPTFALEYLYEAGLAPQDAAYLDIGTGVGKDPRQAVTRYGARSATGIDTSEQVIADARVLTQNLVDQGSRDKINFACTELANHDPSMKYDLVTLTSVLHLMDPDAALALLIETRTRLTARGVISFALKTPNSGDTRPCSEGGLSSFSIFKSPVISLHESKDGLERYYYSSKMAQRLLEATGLRVVDTQTVHTPYGSVDDCEFVIVTGTF